MNRSYRTWTDEELAVLRDSTDLTARELASLLPGRSPELVDAAATRYGIPIRHDPRFSVREQGWTDEEKALVRAAHKAGVKSHDVPALLVEAGYRARNPGSIRRVWNEPEPESEP